MFRLVRLVILLMLAFMAGVFFERFNASGGCDQANSPLRALLCEE